MLNEPTLQKLAQLKLSALATAWTEQQASPEMQRLSFDERLGLLVDAEWLARDNKRLGRRLKEAKLRLSQACLEDIKYGPRRELDPAQLRQLGTCLWVQQHHNVLVTGMMLASKGADQFMDAKLKAQFAESFPDAAIKNIRWYPAVPAGIEEIEGRRDLLARPRLTGQQDSGPGGLRRGVDQIHGALPGRRAADG